MKSAILTIGYEGLTSPEFLARLREAGAQRLIDVRWRPGSRKRGLSKTPLTEQTVDIGISYCHYKNLGTPPEIRRKLRDTGTYDWDEYKAFLAQQTESVEAVAQLAANETIALMCYEADPDQCHRKLVAEALRELTSLEIHHL